MAKLHAFYFAFSGFGGPPMWLSGPLYCASIVRRNPELLDVVCDNLIFTPPPPQRIHYQLLSSDEFVQNSKHKLISYISLHFNTEGNVKHPRWLLAIEGSCWCPAAISLAASDYLDGLTIT